MVQVLYQSKYFTWTTPRQRSDINGPIELFYAYLDIVYPLLTDRFGFNRDDRLPILITIQPSSQCQGAISGSASDSGLGFCAGNWADNDYCYGVLIQELVNFMTGKFGGWPRWWANDHSPFSIQASTQVMFETGRTQQAQTHNARFINDVYYSWFRNLQNRYGWMLWKNLFWWLTTQNIDLHAISEPDKTIAVMTYLNWFGLTA